MKNLKNKILIIACFAFASILMVAASKDDKIINAIIVGTWRVASNAAIAVSNSKTLTLNGAGAVAVETAEVSVGSDGTPFAAIYFDTLAIAENDTTASLTLTGVDDTCVALVSFIDSDGSTDTIKSVVCGTDSVLVTLNAGAGPDATVSVLAIKPPE